MFFGHEPQNNNGGCTFDRIVDAIILKIKSTFDGPTGSLVVKSLCDKREHVFIEPEMEASTKTYPAMKALDTERLLRNWEKDYGHYQVKKDESESLWTKAYALIYNNY